MLSQNNNALGIICPNSYDNTVPELVTERAMASIPFAGRYRMVDFVLSSMANCVSFGYCSSWRSSHSSPDSSSVSTIFWSVGRSSSARVAGSVC